MAENGLILEVEGLRYAYGDRPALVGASFQVRDGEILGFLGPNGAGKTTAISCLCGGLAQWQGEIRFRGAPFRPASRIDHRRRIGIVPQQLAVYEELTARENLMFFGRLSGLLGRDLRSTVASALEFSGLSDRADDLVRRYSGGMKRRLNFALGDLHRPELLLLDEPTVGVDPQSRNHIFECLQGLRASGRSLVYATHYMEEAQRLCDRVAIFNEGAVLAIGTPAELAAVALTPDANLETVFLKLTGRGLRD